MHDLSVEEEEEPEGHLFSQLNTLVNIIIQNS